MVKTKNSGNDKILTVLFVVAILIGFYLVSIVNASFENDKENELLFKTDSSTKFPVIDVINFSPYYDTWQTGIREFIGSTYFEYAKTPVYLGNDTWVISNNATIGAQSALQYIIEIPNMDDWIISNFTFEMDKSITLPNDIEMRIGLFSIATPNVYDWDIELGSISLYTDLNVPVGQFYNETIDLNLAQALNIHDRSMGKAQHFIRIAINDKIGDGMDFSAFKINMEIHGKQIESYNIMQQLNLAIGIAIMINIGVIVFMTDEIDVGGFKNDIPNKKKR